MALSKGGVGATLEKDGGKSWGNLKRCVERQRPSCGQHLGLSTPTPSGPRMRQHSYLINISASNKFWLFYQCEFWSQSVNRYRRLAMISQLSELETNDLRNSVCLSWNMKYHDETEHDKRNLYLSVGSNRQRISGGKFLAQLMPWPKSPKVLLQNSSFLCVPNKVVVLKFSLHSLVTTCNICNITWTVLCNISSTTWILW